MTATNEVKLSQDQINEALTDIAAMFKKHNITMDVDKWEAIHFYMKEEEIFAGFLHEDNAADKLLEARNL